MEIGFTFHDSDQNNGGPFGQFVTITRSTPTGSANESYGNTTLAPGGHAGPGFMIQSAIPNLATCAALGPVMDMTYTLEKTDHTQKLTLAVTGQTVPNPLPDPPPFSYNMNLDGAHPIERTGDDLQWDYPGNGHWIKTTAGGSFTVSASMTLRYTNS